MSSFRSDKQKAKRRSQNRRARRNNKNRRLDTDFRQRTDPGVNGYLSQDILNNRVPSRRR